MLNIIKSVQYKCFRNSVTVNAKYKYYLRQVQSLHRQQTDVFAANEKRTDWFVVELVWLTVMKCEKFLLHFD